MMLERILETEGMGLWIGFDWPRIASKGELLWTRQCTFRFHKYENHQHFKKHYTNQLLGRWTLPQYDAALLLSYELQHHRLHSSDPVLFKTSSSVQKRFYIRNLSNCFEWRKCRRRFARFGV